MIPAILIGLAVVIVLILAIVALQPPTYRVERSTTITAPPANVFPLVNDFHEWEAWSPWEKIDPALKRTYAGSPAGTGAVYSWSGDNKVGEGRMTITDSRPNELVKINLEFIRPFKGNSIAEFTFKPQGNQTLVTWSMTGNKTFIIKFFHLFINMDKMLGGQFEKGLAQMKSQAESPPR